MQASTRFARWGRAAIVAGIAALLAATALLVATPTDAFAASPKATKGAKVYTLKANKLYKSYDITGDKRADRIKIVSSKSAEGGFQGIKVVVNGKTVYRNKKAAGMSSGPQVKLIKLKNGKPFLFLSAYSDNPDTDLSVVLAYKSGKLKTAIDGNKALGKKFSWDSTVGRIQKVSGNTITMTYSTSSYMFGAVEATYSYTYKSGKLKAASTGTFKVAEGKKSYKALKPITVYKNTACKAKKFIIAKGDKVKFTNIFVKGNTVRVKVKVGAKTGWIKCANSYTSPLLYKYVDPQWEEVRYDPPFEGLG